MNVTLLGATGFIGSWAARALIAAGASVTAISRPESDTWRVDRLPGLTLQRVRTEDWPRAIAASRPDTFVMMDWAGVDATERDDDAAQRANLARHSTAIAAALDAGASRVVGTGSQAEYGIVDHRVSEQNTPVPSTAYGRAKVEANAMLESACQDASCQWVWARVFSVFGPLQSGRWLLPSIAKSASDGTDIHLSSGRQPWTFLFAADAATAMSTLAMHPSAAGVYNIAHPDAPPLAEAIEIFSKALGAESLVQFGPTAGASLQADVSRLARLGWAPQWSRDDALTTTAAWYQGASVPDPLLRDLDLPLAS